MILPTRQNLLTRCLGRNTHTFPPSSQALHVLHTLKPWHRSPCSATLPSRYPAPPTPNICLSLPMAFTHCFTHKEGRLLGQPSSCCQCGHHTESDMRSCCFSAMRGLCVPCSVPSNVWPIGLVWRQCCIPATHQSSFPRSCPCRSPHTIRLLALHEQASRAAGSVRTAMTPACVLEKVNEITMREIDVEEPFTEQ